jgi:hypothetical protein
VMATTAARMHLQHNPMASQRNLRLLPCVFLMYAITTVPAWAADVSVQGTSIIDNQTGAPIRGFHAAYQNVSSTRAGIEADLDAMKNQFGLKGFSFEIGWHEVEPTRGIFQWNPNWDMLLDVAQKKGLYVNLILTAHYTPDWVFSQRIDVNVKDEDGNNTAGTFLNYAPSSPAALVWQGDFQRAALEPFKDKPALLSVHLTNDQTWPLIDRVLYVTHDVTEMICQGKNVIGAMLGHGWYSADKSSPGRQPYGDRPRLLAQLMVTLRDGRKLVLGIDGMPTVKSCLRMEVSFPLL